MKTKLLFKLEQDILLGSNGLAQLLMYNTTNI